MKYVDLCKIMNQYAATYQNDKDYNKYVLLLNPKKYDELKENLKNNGCVREGHLFVNGKNVFKADSDIETDVIFLPLPTERIIEDEANK